MIRVVYFGTPAFAVPTLRYLAANRQFEVALVVSQPDRPAGRGRRLESSPVASVARELALPLYQPDSLRTTDARAPLAAAAADVFIVAAYGLIFGPKTLALPAAGCLNVHASLLPAYRGAAPISAALLDGLRETGVTLMRMDVGLDTGPMYTEGRIAIPAGATTESLTAELANLGAELIATALPDIVSGALAPQPQPTAGATLTRPLRKGDGRLDWSHSAEELEREVRAFWPWPRAWTMLPSGPLQVHAATVVSAAGLSPGETRTEAGELVVGCGTDALRLTRVQPAGGTPRSDREWLLGRPDLPRVLPGPEGESRRAPLIVRA